MDQQRIDYDDSGRMISVKESVGGCRFANRFRTSVLLKFQADCEASCQIELALTILRLFY